jgi:hypothetical protein
MGSVSLYLNEMAQELSLTTLEYSPTRLATGEGVHV